VLHGSSGNDGIAVVMMVAVVRMVAEVMMVAEMMMVAVVMMIGELKMVTEGLMVAEVTKDDEGNKVPTVMTVNHRVIGQAAKHAEV